MTTTAPLVVAIDGPAGSGKSTVAKLVALRLGLGYLDTGAMYRSVAWACLDGGVDPSDHDKATDLAKSIAIEISGDPAAPVAVAVDGHDVTAAIRTPEVSSAASRVAVHPGVRAELVARQRQWVIERGGGVLEGRDIATVVFPDAAVKVYLTASDDERAQRRHAENPGSAPLHAVAAELARRDQRDSTRAVDPLQVAAGAVVIDTTGVLVEHVVDAVLELVP